MTIPILASGTPHWPVVRPGARAYRAGMTNPDATTPMPDENQNRAEETLGSPVPEGRTTDGSSVQRDPDDWVTGDEPMTGPQRSYLDTLARQAGETVPENLNKAEASRLIDELQQRTGRGAS